MESALTKVDWASGNWLNPPLSAQINLETNQFVVKAKKESDFWRTTSYGFIHDNGHALLHSFPSESAVEVSFILDYKG